MANMRLLILAEYIEDFEAFNQDEPWNCVIGIGLRLAGFERTISYADLALFAQFYGISEFQTEALYWADYDKLFSDEMAHNHFELRYIEREEVARILRRLATESPFITPNNSGTLSAVDQYLIKNNLI